MQLFATEVGNRHAIHWCMSKTPLASLAIAATFLLGVTAAYAGADPDIGGSITISDKNYEGPANSSPSTDPTIPSNGPGGYGDHEDQETETNPRTYTDQKWDLEGMYVKGSDLTLVGGFDFRDGVPHDGRTYRSGDIFIDTTGDAKYGQVANGGSGTGTSNVKNTFGYDYVIHFNYSGDNLLSDYDVYSLNGDSRVTQVTDVASSNPWRYASGGTELLAGQDFAFGTLSDVSNLQTWGTTSGGLLGDGPHYYLTVDTSFLPTNTNAIVHYTMECGNDNLMGKFKTPDTASTLLMLVGALAGLLGIKRRLSA